MALCMITKALLLAYNLDLSAQAVNNLYYSTMKEGLNYIIVNVLFITCLWSMCMQTVRHTQTNNLRSSFIDFLPAHIRFILAVSM